jgi:diguanylate cyclase (GGDEF)-like protein
MMAPSLRVQVVLLSALTTVLLALVSHSASASTEFRLQLRWMHQFQFAGYYMALEKGYYEKAGLSVELIEGGPHALEPVSDLLDSKVDFAVSNSGVVIYRMAGEPVVALAAIAQTSPIVWIVRDDSDIHTPLDLAGKRLMLMPEPESAELLAMLRREGISLDELELLPTSYDLDELIRGEVDAYDGYISNEPYFLTQRGVGFRLLEPREYGVNFYNDVLIAKQSLIEEKPSEVAAFVDASLRGWVYALNNVEETAELIQRRYAPHKTLDHLVFEGYQLKDLIMPELVSPGHMNPGRWKRIARSYVDLEMSPGPVDLDGFLYSPRTEQGHPWFHRIAIISVLVLSLISIVAVRFARLNSRLLKEASRREAVELALRGKQAELYRLANTDPLTGLWNRMKFEEVAGQELMRSQRYEYPLSLLFIDIDHFKPINDERGHAVGDQVLRSLAGLLLETLRQSDSVCRWGGEEFLILAPYTDLEQAIILGEKLRSRVASKLSAEGLAVTVSLGVAERLADDDLPGLVRRADDALYEAKAAGRNRVAAAPSE